MASRRVGARVELGRSKEERRRKTEKGRSKEERRRREGER